MILAACMPRMVLFMDLDFVHWTCHFEAGPGPFFYFQQQYSIVVGLGCRGIGLVVLKLGHSAGFWNKSQTCYCDWTWMMGRWICHLKSLDKSL